MLYWFMGISTTHAYFATILPQHDGAIIKSEYEDTGKLSVNQILDVRRAS